MKNLFILMLATISLTAFSQPGNKNFIDQNYIEVTGKAEMEIVPDEIYLKILLNEKELKGNQTVDEVEQKMISKLEATGIDVSRALSVKDMVSNFRQYWILGADINAQKEYQLVVTAAKTVGRVFQTLHSLGISNISIERVDHSQLEKFKTEVKINAIKAAKEKAASLTQAIGQSAGQALYIQELNSHIYGAYKSGESMMANMVVKARGGNESAAPQIEFEKIKLEYSILVRFELQ
ncbi:SIMPL domain-containing protein [Marinilabilia salmonicolor]|uniref:SIMPL domain-containing protein n=1 Tax=Marinilabilia salmonicolor TaxID=989 RepID=UPI00029B1CD0|nr:SIMPL domain-containing protein [Marinilabilia salmonicolor]